MNSVMVGVLKCLETAVFIILHFSNYGMSQWFISMLDNHNVYHYILANCAPFSSFLIFRATAGGEFWLGFVLTQVCQAFLWDNILCGVWPLNTSDRSKRIVC
jgi:hypothetical protein